MTTTAVQAPVRLSSLVLLAGYIGWAARRTHPAALAMWAVLDHPPTYA